MSESRIESRIFKPTPSIFIKQTFEIWLFRYGWILSLPVIACLFGALFRWEWIIVALALCLIVYPFGLFILYIRFGLSDDGIKTIRYQQITCTESKIVVSYLKPNSEKELFSEIERIVYPWDVFKSVVENKKGFILRFMDEPMKFIYVPLDAICENKDKFFEILRENGILFVK